MEFDITLVEIATALKTVDGYARLVVLGLFNIPTTTKLTNTLKFVKVAKNPQIVNQPEKMIIQFSNPIANKAAMLKYIADSGKQIIDYPVKPA